jgi:hypothetical protein
MINGRKGTKTNSISLSIPNIFRSFAKKITMSLFSPKNKKAWILVAHLMGWAVFLYMTVPLQHRMAHQSDYAFSMMLGVSCLFLIAYFYYNKNVVVPRFLPKQIMAFLGITLLAYMIFSLIIPNLIHHFYQPEIPPYQQPELDHIRILHIDIVGRFGLYSRSSQFLLVFIVSTGLKVFSQWYAEKQHLQELEKSMVQAELSFLKSQIHPHFLFNCLNSIYYLTLSKDDKAPKVILSLSDFLRFVTVESNNNRIPLEKEVKMLEEYIHLQSLRASEKFELQFQVKGTFTDLEMMPLTFIPFVENAFKYGISAHISCFIHILIEVENDVLKFTCNNSIVTGINEKNHSEGVGLENIKKRLELAYPQCHSLVIRQNSQAYMVELQIKLS